MHTWIGHRLWISWTGLMIMSNLWWIARKWRRQLPSQSHGDLDQRRRRLHQRQNGFEKPDKGPKGFQTNEQHLVYEDIVLDNPVFLRHASGCFIWQMTSTRIAGILIVKGRKPGEVEGGRNSILEWSWNPTGVLTEKSFWLSRPVWSRDYPEEGAKPAADLALGKSSSKRAIIVLHDAGSGQRVIDLVAKI